MVWLSKLRAFGSSAVLPSRSLCLSHLSGIAYQSQSEDFLTRIHRKRERLEATLGGRWSRPKGMHRTTYKRLISQIRECESVLDNLLWRFLDSRGWT